MLEHAHVTLVTLGVRDVSVSTSFYESVGFVRSSASNDSVSFFRAGTVVLSLFGREALAEDARVPSDGVGFRGVSLAINVRSEPAVDAIYAQWVGAGATPVKAPEHVFWGGYSSYVGDLDGH